jgi:Domain of unknown function (DUF4864)
MTVRCANCGRGVFSAAKLCPFCRQPIVAMPSELKGAPAKPVKPKTSVKIARWQIVLTSAVVIVGLGSLFLFRALSGLVEPIDRQLDAFRRNDMVAAYAETSTGFQQEIPYEEFLKVINNIPSLSHNVSRSFTSRSAKTLADGTNRGDVIGSITDDQGGILPVHYELVKENGNWKIKGLQFGRKIAARH